MSARPAPSGRSAGSSGSSIRQALDGDLRWLFFIVSFAILGVIVPLVLVNQVSAQSARSTGWVLALGLMCWCGLRMAMLIAAGDARFFAMFFWLFTYIFMGVAPAVQMRRDLPSTTTADILPTADVGTMGVVILGVVCYEIGTGLAWLSRRRSMRATTTAAPRFGTASASAAPLRPSAHYGVRPVVTVVMAAVGLAFTLYYITQVTRGVLFTSRELAAATRAVIWPDPPTRAAILALAIYPLLIGIGGLVQLRHSSRAWLVRIAYGGAILIGTAALLVAVNPISSARYTLGTVVFALIVLFGAANTRTRARLSMASMIFGLFFLFPLADAFRLDVADFSRAGFFGEYASNPDYDSIWQVANAISYWNSGESTAGFQALGLLGFWVPRSIWPTKPLDTGVVLANFNGYSVTNLSAPLWAEAIVNGGLVAMVVVFVLIGYVLRRFDDRLIRALDAGVSGVAPGIWLLIGAAFPAYFMILLRGSLLQATGAVAVILGCLLLVWKPSHEAEVRAADQAVDPDPARAPA